ncbi:mersacidin/lichenicidin family type 2 lantibiotic, partial [Bacillus toyonensis]|uniref:mersacidin/lichenicidin family type 2 lantibiotic n=1 Tax=Bacillus toyonensis TaxID=155322 RepID=UPI0027B95C24
MILSENKVDFILRRSKNMTNEEIIVAWKNPKVRGKNMPSHPSGVGFQELSINEMAQVTGGAVEQRAT